LVHVLSKVSPNLPMTKHSKMGLSVLHDLFRIFGLLTSLEEVKLLASDWENWLGQVSTTSNVTRYPFRDMVKVIGPVVNFRNPFYFWK